MTLYHVTTFIKLLCMYQYDNITIEVDIKCVYGLNGQEISIQYQYNIIF